MNGLLCNRCGVARGPGERYDLTLRATAALRKLYANEEHTQAAVIGGLEAVLMSTADHDQLREHVQGLEKRAEEESA